MNNLCSGLTKNGKCQNSCIAETDNGNPLCFDHILMWFNADNYVNMRSNNYESSDQLSDESSYSSSDESSYSSSEEDEEQFKYQKRKRSDKIEPEFNSKKQKTSLESNTNNDIVISDETDQIEQVIELNLNTITPNELKNLIQTYEEYDVVFHQLEKLHNQCENDINTLFQKKQKVRYYVSIIMNNIAVKFTETKNKMKKQKIDDYFVVNLEDCPLDKFEHHMSTLTYDEFAYVINNKNHDQNKKILDNLNELFFEYTKRLFQMDKNLNQISHFMKAINYEL